MIVRFPDRETRRSYPVTAGRPRPTAAAFHATVITAAFAAVALGAATPAGAASVMDVAGDRCPAVPSGAIACTHTQ